MTNSPSLSRREFLTSAAASAASAVPLTAALQPPVGRIDCQSHLFCPEVVALMDQAVGAGWGAVSSVRSRAGVDQCPFS